MNKMKTFLLNLLVFLISASATYVIFELGIALSLATMKFAIKHHSTIVLIIATIVGLIFGASAKSNNKGDK